MSITLDLPDDLTAELSKCAESAGLSASDFIAHALRRHLANERSRDVRERLAQRGEVASLKTDDAGPSGRPTGFVHKWGGSAKRIEDKADVWLTHINDKHLR